MKYQILASIGVAIFGIAATVSAFPLAPHEEESFCPKGYKMVVWYETVWPTPSATSTLETSSTPSASSTPEALVQSQSPVEVESSTPIGDAAASTSTPAPAPVPTTSSTSSSVPKSEAPVPETTQAVVFATSTESSTAQIVAPTTHAAAQVITFSETTSLTTPSTSVSTSTAQAAGTTSSNLSSPSSSSSSGTPGEATFYGGNVAGGTCSFSDYTLPSSLFGTALSVDQWSDASKCGACVAVTGPNGKTIKAMIVDQCPSCASNHFDLFEDAFSELSDPSTGVIDITWSYTPCDLDGPLKLKNKSGTSEYWFSMQVVNANEPVAKLEVSTDGGSTWQGTTRTYYNYFEQSSGFGTDTVTVRVTGESGNTVTVQEVGSSSESEFTASSNL
ncbi:uncharacterized protein N7498_010442 [Penicillium cinerascens]|uniref:Expansin-like EG45 domain-containing protein n=1 Tax=Penicillium cinerascens TaxID=70096 RepID=A0A9W9J8G4_9EURO|nr:uncharacterized protein N7498_010442 [Penicillium cinerascens]KAJ5191457.1 hypothetical protein N7498_010442 [Penicillium cinerascens]